MRLSLRQALEQGYDRVVLSPHFDDAALSLGGSIAAWSSAGERVLVVTVCAGLPPPDAPITPIVGTLHGRARLGVVEYVEARRREDEAAMALLGADFVWLDGLDAIYRAPTAYPDSEQVFASPHARDELASYVEASLRPLRASRPLYVPLGVGRHVDHVLVARGAARLGEVVHYEDLPYALDNAALAAALAERDPPLAPELLDIGETLERKLAAVAAYTTQVPMLFDDVAGMRQKLVRHARAIAGVEQSAAERLWRAPATAEV
jgi:LmbE family N-acetylglucosaminyl deacetylase